VTPACAPSSVAVAVSGCSPYAIGGWDGKNSTPCAAGNGASGAPSCRWGCGTHSRHGRRFASAYMGPRASAAGSSRGRWHRGTRRLLRRGLTSQQLHHLLKSRPRLSIVAGVLPHRAYCAARSSHWPRNDRAGRAPGEPGCPHFGAREERELYSCNAPVPVILGHVRTRQQAQTCVFLVSISVSVSAHEL